QARLSRRGRQVHPLSGGRLPAGRIVQYAESVSHSSPGLSAERTTLGYDLQDPREPCKGSTFPLTRADTARLSAGTKSNLTADDADTRGWAGTPRPHFPCVSSFVTIGAIRGLSLNRRERRGRGDDSRISASSAVKETTTHGANQHES